MAPFYGWGSTASRLEPLRGGSLLFTTKFPETPGTLRLITYILLLYYNIQKYQLESDFSDINFRIKTSKKISFSFPQISLQSRSPKKLIYISFY